MIPARSQSHWAAASLTPPQTPSSFSLLDTPGLLALGAFVFSIPAIYLNTGFADQRICQLLAAAAIATNLHHFHPARLSLPMIFLGALCAYFSITAIGSTGTEAWVDFSVWAKFVACAILLSCLVRTRTQCLVVLVALAASALVVTYASRRGLYMTQEAVEQPRITDSVAPLNRTAGVFANANIMGMYAVDAIVAAVTFYLTTRKPLSLALCIGSSAAAGYLALFSGSRKAMLGIGVVVVFVVWMALRARAHARLITRLVALLIAGTGVLWLIDNPYLVRFTTNEESYQMRAELIHEALASARDHPLCGLGYHGFQHISSSGLYTHSTPLEILCNGGVVALALYILLWLTLCRSLYRCIVLETDQKELSLLYGMGCYCAVQVIDSLTSVVTEEPRYLVVTACICGYLRSKELAGRKPGIPTAGPATPGTAPANGSRRLAAGYDPACQRAALSRPNLTRGL